MLRTVSSRLGAMDITLRFDDSVKAYIAKEGFDPVYGARPLRRAIQTKVEDAFAEQMLDGSVTAGDQVLASVSDGKVIFTKQEAQAAAKQPGSAGEEKNGEETI